MDIFNGVRLRVWAKQPDEFFEQAVIDADGTILARGGRLILKRP